MASSAAICGVFSRSSPTSRPDRRTTESSIVSREPALCANAPHHALSSITTRRAVSAPPRLAWSAPPIVFCTPKVNSELCAPSIAFSGYPTISGAGPFTISASSVLNNRTGLLFYGYGTASKNFQGGTLCCRTPVRRTALQTTGGAPTGSDCTGTLSFDMHSLLASGSDSNLVPGVTVAAQYYYRDPQDAHGVGLTDALLFVVCP